MCPMYTYRCPTCGKEIETIERAEDLDKETTYCPDCKTSSGIDVGMERVIVAAPKFVLKGGCWAKDNYR